MKQFYSAALYLRLSRDDGAEQSSSIKTQQIMLEKYCSEQKIHIYEVYIDDGYSGLNYDRPAFQRLLEDIKQGYVNLVITKDLSRLGRDYIQTGYYTELFFPQHNVRYIALTDGVDTLHDNNDIAPFKNILNDMYAKDLSRKVKTAKRTRAAQGAFIGSHAPYGYKKSSESCNVLEINKETAEVVQKIFRLALHGIGAVSIAKQLRAEKILTPSAYKVQQGERHFAYLFEGAPEEKQYRWAYTTVHRILRDRVYLGHMISHKSQVDHYKTKHRSLVPESGQIVVENTHPPLVSQEDFDKVQLLIRARHNPRNDYDGNIFRALLYCNECGHRLSMATKVYKTRSVKYYRCMHHYHYPSQCHNTHFIRFDDIYKIILTDIRCIAELLTYRMDSLVKMLDKSENSGKDEKAAKLVKLQSRMETVDKIIGQLYEDFAAGKTTVHNNNRLLQKYQQEQEKISGELKSMQGQLANTYDQAARLKQLRKAAENHLDIKELEIPMLHELIQKIYVGQREKTDGKWVQDIKIEYRFAGDIPV